MFYFNICSSRYNLPKLILSGILILVLYCQVSAQSEQNKRRIGKFTKCEIKSVCNTIPPSFPPWLLYPKDTVITASSSLRIPISVECPDFSFTGELEIDFPYQTSIGTWTKSPSPSRILLDNTMTVRVRVHGIFYCPLDNSITDNYYGYEIRAYTASSTLEGACSDRSKIVKRDSLRAGSNAIDVEAFCSFSLFEIQGPTYEYDPMQKYWNSGFYFRFRKWFGADIDITTSIKTSYLFERVTGPIIGVSSTSLTFTSKPKGDNQSRKITLSNAGTPGSDQLDFSTAVSTTDGGTWLSVSKSSGSLQPQQSTELEITVFPSLPLGTYIGQVTISAPNTMNSPVIISVWLRITENKLSLKFDPQKIKCSEWTTLEISVVDEDENLVTDFSGGAEVRLLKNLSTEKITKLPEYQSVLITNGKAQPIFIFTPKESFNADSAITNNTVLSGKIFIEVKLENSTIPADTAELTVYSPIDFFIDHIEVQQGVKYIDKEVSLEYKPGEYRTFPARNFIANHSTVVRAFVGYRKTIDIPFLYMNYKMKGSLQIFEGGRESEVYEMGKPTLDAEIDSSTVKDMFSEDERINLQDALFTLLPSHIVIFGGSYDFEATLNLEKLFQYEDEIQNNRKTYGARLVDTKYFHVLAISAKLDEEEYQYVDGRIFNYIKDAFPIEEYELRISDPNSNKHSFKNGWLMLSVNYWNALFNILNRQNEQAASGKQYYCILTLASDALLEKFAVTTTGACNDINGKACVIRLSHNKASQAISHELGHILGLKETSTVSWMLTGDPNPRRSNANDVGNWIEEGNIYLPEIKQALGTNNYHDIMSELDSRMTYWMDRVTWDYLYKKFVLSPLKKSSSQDVSFSGEYIAVSGSISESDTVILNPLIKMDQVPMLDDTLDGDYSVEFYNFTGQLLTSYKFSVVFLIPGVKKTSVVPFCLYLPLPQGVKKMSIKKQGTGGESKILIEKYFSDNAPQVQIVSPTQGDSITDNFVIKWTAFDPDGDDLTYDIIYSPNDTTRIIIASNLTDTTFTWNAAAYDGCTDGSITVIANDGINDGKAKVGSLTEVKYEDIKVAEIKDFKLAQSYPNPFNPNTVISYQLPVNSKVSLKVFDILGREVATLVNEEKKSGNYKIEFNGSKLSSGIYFYQFSTGNYIETKKMILIK